MTRKTFAFAILTLLLFACLSCAFAEEEGRGPATPTDLDCAHEHTKTTIYFFDSPVYTALNAESHRVSGPATVETVCLDCGETLSAESSVSAEEIRPHSFRKGACALCGYRLKEKPVADAPEDEPGERTIFAEEDTEAAGLMTLTLTSDDLAKLENDSISTLLVRGETGEAAVALDVAEVRTQTEQAKADLYLQLAEQEDGSLFAGLYLVTEPGEMEAPEEEGISLRFYRKTRTNVRVSLAPAATEELVEAEGEWNDRGFWSVPYLEEGTYFLLQ